MTRQPRPLAKLSMPLAAGAVRRERLFRSLDALRSRFPVLWIAAPGGAGKTVLISSYLQDGNLPALWFQLDAADADPSGFFRYLGQAVAAAAPRRRRPMPLFTPEYHASGELFSRRWFEEMGRRLKASSVIVFDNGEAVGPDAGLWSLLAHGLRALPPGISVIFTSRHEPPPAFAHLTINGTLGTLGWQEVKVAQDEAELIGARQGLCADAARRLNERSGGWMAALIAMLGQAQRGDATLPPAEGPPRVLFDFFAHDIFARLPADTRSLLLQTAFLPDVTVAAAERLSGDAGAGRLLAAACSAHLFTERLAGSPTAYRYHPLFRDFLVQQCATVYAPSEVAEIKRQSAELLADAGDFNTAIRLLAEAGESDAALAGLLEHAPALINEGRNRTVLDLLDSLPADRQEASPWCAYWRGIAEQPYAPAAARAQFVLAFNRFEAAGDLAGALRCWGAVVETIFHEWDHFQQIDPWIAWLDETARKQLVIADPELELRVSSTMTAALTMRGGDPGSLDRWARRAILALDAVQAIYPRLSAIVYCTNYLAWVQPPGLDSAAIEITLRDAGQAELPPILRLTAIYTRAALALRRSPDMRELLDEVRTALALADATGVHVWDEILFGLAVHCAIVLEERGTADAYLAKMRRNASAQRKQGLAFYYYIQAWSHLVFGAINEAREAIRQALHLYAQTGYDFPSNVAYYGAAIICAEAGELDTALAYAQQADRTAENYRTFAMRHSTLLTLAFVHYRRGDTSAASETLREAFRIGRQGGYYLTLWWWHAPMMSTLANLALRENIEREHVIALIRRMRLKPADPGHVPDAWPWPVELHVLGGFELLIDGTPPEQGRKPQQKTLALLKALAAAGPQGASTTTLADRLWPEAEGDKAQHALEMALHRARKMLGGDETLQVQNGEIRLNPRLCRVDAHVFAAEVDAGLREFAAGRHEAARRALQQGLSHYRGALLGTDRGDAWILSARERLAAKFLAGIEALGTLYENGDELEQALALYRRALELDGRSEPLLPRYVRCCRALGREAETTAVQRLLPHTV